MDEFTINSDDPNKEKKPQAQRSKNLSPEDFSHHFLHFIDKWNWNQNNLFQFSKPFPHAFLVNEEDLKKLNGQVEDSIKAINQSNDIQFSGATRFPDLTTSRYNNLTELLKKAGNKTDPEQLTLKWHCFLNPPMSSFVEIEIIFTTEKPLEIDEFKYSSAKIGRAHV